MVKFATVASICHDTLNINLIMRGEKYLTASATTGPLCMSWILCACRPLFRLERLERVADTAPVPAVS